MAQKVGVLCKSCGEPIEIEDDFLPGLRASAVAASFYREAAEATDDHVNPAWRGELLCGNRTCRKTHSYTSDDLRLCDG